MTFVLALGLAAILQAGPDRVTVEQAQTLLHPSAAIARQPRPEPTVSILDQASDAVIVRGVQPGTRVDLYANGRWMGWAVSRGTAVRVPLQQRLRPGMRVTASVRGSGFVGTTAPTLVSVDYTTYHFDTPRTGWNPYESTLTVSNVGSSAFGPLFNLSVDGNVYAQPLYVSQLTMPDSTVHNVLYVATTNCTLYAFDADTGTTLWQRSFVNTKHGIYNVTAGNVDNHNVWPTIGIVATPVIDRSADAIFVVTATRVGQGPNAVFQHQLHSIALETGLDNVNSPATIAGSVQMTDGSTETFASQWELSRAALLLNGGTVYIGFGSHGDIMSGIARGWIMGYDELSLTPTGIFCTVRDPANILLDTIWAAGFGLSADEFGNIYFATGNGASSANTGGTDYGNAVVKLSASLAFEDFFAPRYGVIDPLKDLGSGGVMVLPDQGGTYPHIAVMAGKGPHFYVLNRDDLGGYAYPAPDRTIQTISKFGVNYKGVHGGPAYAALPSGQYVYVVANLDYLRAYQVQTAPKTQLVLAGTSANTFPGEGGSIPVVSSNGQAPGSAIVWATTRPNDIADTPVTLRAYDASNVSDMLFEGQVGYWFNSQGNPYLTPTVINGKVYVGYGNGVAVFGLKSGDRIRYARPR